MTGFLRSQFRRYLRKEEFLNKFFNSDFDLSILEERKSHYKGSKSVDGWPSTSGLKDPKEEPVEDMILDLENHRYSFYLRPRRGWGVGCYAHVRCTTFCVLTRDVL